MEFKNSPYYNQKFLGKNLYNDIYDMDEVLTAQEFFKIDHIQKEYFKDGEGTYGETYNYKLTIQDQYYELDFQKYDAYLYLVFDKPVHVTGKHCVNIVAPEIIIKSQANTSVNRCVTKKITINNGCNKHYSMYYSKANNVYFFNSKVNFSKSEVSNFFIFNKDLDIDTDSSFFDYHQIKCFGECEDLKIKNKNFKEGIIHIE